MRAQGWLAACDLRLAEPCMQGGQGFALRQQAEADDRPGSHQEPQTWPQL